MHRAGFAAGESIGRIVDEHREEQVRPQHRYRGVCCRTYETPNSTKLESLKDKRSSVARRFVVHQKREETSLRRACRELGSRDTGTVLCRHIALKCGISRAQTPHRSQASEPRIARRVQGAELTYAKGFTATVVVPRSRTIPHLACAMGTSLYKRKQAYGASSARLRPESATWTATMIEFGNLTTH